MCLFLHSTYDHPDDFKDLLSETFSVREKVKDTTGKSVWDRMNVIFCEKPDNRSSAAWLSACSSKIKEVISWLNNDVQKILKRKDIDR